MALIEKAMIKTDMIKTVMIVRAITGKEDRKKVLTNTDRQGGFNKDGFDKDGYDKQALITRLQS
jgi:hypothetical protein